MSEKELKRRLVICIDATPDEFNDNVSPKARNATTIARVSSIVKDGPCYSNGGSIRQIVKYYTAPSSASGFASKFTAKSNEGTDELIRDIVTDICGCLLDSDDELYFFASGRAAFIVNAVVGTMCDMGLPKPEARDNIAALFQNTLDLVKARKTDDSLNGGRALDFLRSQTITAPKIVFVGLFDAMKPANDRQIYNTSTQAQIRHFRHALAFNENKTSLPLDVPVRSTSGQSQGQTFISAWFMGGHQDLIGGTQHDGLGLYALQWMVIESILLGLVFAYNKAETVLNTEQNPLALIFPQFAGKAPNLADEDRTQWQLLHGNNIKVRMYDLQSVHVARPDATEPSHTIYISSSNASTRKKVFNPTGLIGWCPDEDQGTIIHPSMFCLLDRNQHFFEHARFKPFKEQFAEFEVNCLKSGQADVAPWLANADLQASGVKAFRILVCGKTGVGKSTLINKVFGVEMTEESTSYVQGNHDINQAFESSAHPGLLVHDSRGWQAGNDHELELIAQFLRHRAFQKDPAEALHVIWFCVDSDVSRIETADKRTFETIAKFSNHVPVIVVGTKKDKLMAYHKMQLLESFMEKTDDYKESTRLASAEAERLTLERFGALKDQLSQIKDYKADGYVCLSKTDEAGVKALLDQTLELIVDERVRLFAVAAQVVDVESKIESAITECMRLGTHAIRTAMVPLPFSGMIGTPTVSRILCEHVLQCFGFPKAMPDAVEEVMSRVVLGNLKSFMTVSLTQFMVSSGIAVGVGIATVGIGAILGAVGCVMAAPPTARMLLKCACDMILIMERSFRYGGKWVSVKQIEDAAKQYVTVNTKTFVGKDKRLQEQVHDEVDKLVPLKSVKVGWKFLQLRTGFEEIVQKNRFDRPPAYGEAVSRGNAPAGTSGVMELLGSTKRNVELDGAHYINEMDGESPAASHSTEVGRREFVAELPGSTPSTLPFRTTTNLTRSSSVNAPETLSSQSDTLERYGSVRTDNSSQTPLSNAVSKITSPQMVIEPDTIPTATSRPDTQGRKDSFFSKFKVKKKSSK